MKIFLYESGNVFNLFAWRTGRRTNMPWQSDTSLDITILLHMDD